MAKRTDGKTVEEKDARSFGERVIEILEQLDKRAVGTDVLIANLKADFVVTEPGAAAANDAASE